MPDGLLIEGELTDTATLTRVLTEHGIEAVMHFAAFALVNESVNDPAAATRTMSLQRFRSSRRCVTADMKKFVFSSTTATYGEPDQVPISEDTPQRPINPYGFTKLVIEQALADYAEAYGMGYAAFAILTQLGHRWNHRKVTSQKHT